jgi:hypothetical protein
MFEVCICGIHRFFRVGSVAASVLLAGSCTTTTEIILPALDASKTVTAEALVVHIEHMRSFDPPSDVIRGAGEGALMGAGAYVGGVGHAGGDGALLGLLLAPIGLPVSAAIGASLAHSEEEVVAAVGAFESVGHDKEFLTSIGRRVIGAMGKYAETHWACVEVATVVDQEPCSGYMPVARLELRPSYTLRSVGRYDPDIQFLGNVVAVASINYVEDNAKAIPVLEAKWAYREDLGSFFALAQNDAALLRRKLNDILDRFASRIANDFYLVPSLETINRKKEISGHIFTEIPKGVIVRTEQGFDLHSLATHGIVRPTGRSFGEDCWIDTVEGTPTGHTQNTAAINRHVNVKAGNTRLKVTCVRFTGSLNEKSETHSIKISVDPGVIYETDGRTYQRLER